MELLQNLRNVSFTGKQEKVFFFFNIFFKIEMCQWGKIFAQFVVLFYHFYSSYPLSYIVIVILSNVIVV